MWEKFFDDETKIAMVTLVVAVVLLFGVLVPPPAEKPRLPVGRPV